MTSAETESTTSVKNRGLRWSHVAWIILATIIVTMGVTYWIVRTYIYASDFKPVVLKQKEVKVLNDKLRKLGFSPQSAGSAQTPGKAPEFDEQGNLRPEKYDESGASREVSFSERELNALLANNTNLARKLAIDLSDELVSAKLLVPVDPEFPLLGGKTLRVTGGLGITYSQSKPIVILRGISIMGVPLPNAWLGGMKNIDLVNEFGASEGFWKSFAEGVEDIRVENGRLKVRLKE
jgi:hypothetical protein